jgi:hypothetical protein
MIVPFVFIFVAELLLPMFKYSEEQTKKLKEQTPTGSTYSDTSYTE